ncbi:hypothetical protein CLOBOL_05799 [Enterocloster bolteae ATCC BAA-613]|uniref:Uncharacterized protein n=1 Tax=Enterocloster bolteae (strain ATCC BAA-613 / DSM 15670 / CCUG 46953 / JCM 12243 / WAL 16351) TaxID=411902 RepID=A8S0X6_ENTBW|nr:hypothetical protein CLOBOL_05799 [Enterocloster bolteae ATCC BAA-613]
MLCFSTLHTAYVMFYELILPQETGHLFVMFTDCSGIYL